MLKFITRFHKCVKNSIKNFHISDSVFFFYVEDLERIGGKYVREEYLYEAISYRISKGNVVIEGHEYPVRVKEYKGGGARVLDILDEDVEKRPNQNTLMDIFDERYDRNMNGVSTLIEQRDRMQNFTIIAEFVCIFCLWKSCGAYLQSATTMSLIKVILTILTLMACAGFYRKTHSY